MKDVVRESLTLSKVFINPINVSLNQRRQYNVLYELTHIKVTQRILSCNSKCDTRFCDYQQNFSARPGCVTCQTWGQIHNRSLPLHQTAFR